MRVIVFCWRQSFRLCHKTGLSQHGNSLEGGEEEATGTRDRRTEEERAGEKRRQGAEARRRGGGETREEASQRKGEEETKLNRLVVWDIAGNISSAR